MVDSSIELWLRRSASIMRAVPCPRTLFMIVSVDDATGCARYTIECASNMAWPLFWREAIATSPWYDRRPRAFFIVGLTVFELLVARTLTVGGAGFAPHARIITHSEPLLSFYRPSDDGETCAALTTAYGQCRDALTHGELVQLLVANTVVDTQASGAENTWCVKSVPFAVKWNTKPRRATVL